MVAPEIELELPLAPSANRIWKNAGARVFRSKEYERWLNHAGLLANRQHPPRIIGPYELAIEVARPDERRRDLDNLVKATSDFLVRMGLVEDDYLAQVITSRWVSTGSGMLVRVKPAEVLA
jgi:crossover junction endodeoxyribonuclease RusA